MDLIFKGFLVKESSPRDNYLGNNYQYHDYKTYAAESIARTAWIACLFERRVLGSNEYYLGGNLSFREEY